MNLSTDESAWKLLCQKTLICRVLKGGLLIVIVPSLPEILKVRGGCFFYFVVIGRIGERTKSSQERLHLLCFVGQGFKGFAKLCLFFIIYFSEYVVFYLRFTYICINEIRFQDLRLHACTHFQILKEIVWLLHGPYFKMSLNIPIIQKYV